MRNELRELTENMKIEKKTKDMKPKRIILKERVFCPVLIFSFFPLQIWIFTNEEDA